MRKAMAIGALLGAWAMSACSGGKSTGGTGGTGTDGGTDGGSTVGTQGNTGSTGAGDVGTLCTGLGSTLPTVFTSCLKATPAFVGTLRTDFGKNTCQDVDAAVAKGRASYDANKGGACLAAFQSAASACADLEVTFASSACQGVVKGTVGNGSACYTDVDCAAGSCDTSSACPGTCLAWLTTGQTCGTGGATCAPGLACDAVSGTCKTESAAGGPCPCQPGTFCDGGTSTCAARKTSGSCTGDQCAFGYACVAGSCTALVGLGAACTPPASAGDTSACGLGAYCDGATSKCVAWPGVGESCAAFPICQSGFCDATTRVCTAPKPNGATCASPVECQAESYCDLFGDQTCKGQLADGAACTLGFQCLSGNCAGSKCAPGTAAACHEQ